MKKFFLFFTLSLILHGLLFVRCSSLNESTKSNKIQVKIQIKQNTTTKEIDSNQGPKNISPQVFQASSVDQLGKDEVKTNYIQAVITQINQFKDYPFVAKQLKASGQNEIELIIFQDGSFRYQFSKKSQFDFFDKATTKIFESIKGFEPIPNLLEVDQLELTIPIEYEY